MRKRIWIPSSVLLIVCLAFFLLRQQKTQTRETAAPNAADNTVKVATRIRTNNDVHAASGSKESRNLPANATPLARAIAETNAAAALTLSMWQTPIDFYGKVVDENTNPIVGATVHFEWVEAPTEDGNRQTNTQSDMAGRFSLRGQRGPNLTVLVSKEGYYPRSGGAKYGPINNPDFVPDENEPIVFRLRNKGSPEPLIHMKQNFRIPRDGTPLAIDLIDGKSAAGENGNFVVRCWTSDAGKHSGERYDWRCVISIPGGGVVTTRDEFPFQAPEIGYRSRLEINMPVDHTNWSSQVDLKLYYHLSDGRFGKMDFSMVSFGQHFCMIDSLLNPSGSRNLEPPN